MDKKAKIKFLEGEIVTLTQSSLMAQRDYNMTTGMVLAGKPNDEILAAQTRVKKAKEVVDMQIRYTRLLIDEINKEDK